MTSAKPLTPARSWLWLAGVLSLLEVLFVYEAVQADFANMQKVFGVFAGAAILCFGTLLYSIKTVFYDSDQTEAS